MNYRIIMQEAFEDFITGIKKREENNDRILSNIVIAGGAWEKWFQFEFINRISNKLNQNSDYKYLIYPENKYRDITIYKNENNEANIESIIELKISGNWHVKDWQIDNILSDIVKLEKYDLPKKNKFSIVFNTYANPKHEILDWMEKQIKSKIGFRNEKEYLNKIKDYIKQRCNYPIQDLKNISFSNEIFEEVSIGGLLIEVQE